MRISLVAERYAKALFDLAEERNETDSIYADAVELDSVCRGNRMFVLLLKSPVIGEEKKEKVIKAVFGTRLNDLTMRFLLILVRKGREMYIPEIAHNLIALYKEFRQILTVRLTTAIPASESVRTTVRDIMKEYTGWKIEIEEVVDAGITGGFILNWNDMQYDAGIRHQIDRLHRSSARVNLYVKGF